MVPLREIHSELPELVHRHLIFDEFRNGLDPDAVTYVVDGFHHRPIHPIGRHVAHEGAVYLEVVYRQVLEVAEGRKAAAEIVQGKAAAEILKLADEARCAGEVGNGDGLSDLKA